MQICGLGVSPGAALGRILILEKGEAVIPDDLIREDQTESEVERFLGAHRQAVEETDRLYQEASVKFSAEVAAIFEAHKMILEDQYSLVEPIELLIREKHWNAARAADTQMQELISFFEGSDDPFFRSRAADARDIRDLLIKHLLGTERADACELRENTIIVTRELTPSDTAKMELDKVAGFISEIGGPTAHAAIMSKSLEIPAVSQVENAAKRFVNGQQVLLDGTRGLIETEVTDELLAEFMREKDEEDRRKAQAQAYLEKPTLTADGHRLELWANIGSPKDIPRVLSSGAEGIGLFRSEFLYMDSDSLPDEETQFQAYRTVVEAMAPRPVVIRTLDVGGDKALPALSLEREDNPFLGYRAIRICLDRPELFQVQLRALLRAGAYGDLRIMFPMISCLEELREAKKALDTAKKALMAAGTPFKADIMAGMMIEVPAAAVMADEFAKEVDFFSIGTNDLTQYTLAVDRGSPKITHLYRADHPAVLHLIHHTIEAAHRHGIPCGVCGEAGGDPAIQPLLIQYGIDELSMAPALILKTRMQIAEMRIS